MIQLIDGFKYQLAAPWERKLKAPIAILRDYSNRYFWATTDGRIGAYEGCAWDGPTWCPDIDLLMEASLGHDILHWLIQRGVISAWDNPLIDLELEYIAQDEGPLPKVLGVKLPVTKALLARVARRATGLCNEKEGNLRPVIEISRDGRRVLPVSLTQRGPSGLHG